MATIRDVAKYAGVSTATVSRVLNKKDVVSEETLQKVTEAVEKLSYHPNLLARSLMQGKNDTIGVLLPSFDHPYWGEMAQRLDQAAKKRGYYLLFTEYSGKEEEKRKAFEYLVTRKVGGIIACCPLEKEAQERLRGEIRKVEMPLLSFVWVTDSFPQVIPDDRQGGLLAARHLLAKGCRNIVHVSGDLKMYKETNERTYAFVREIEKRGHTCIIYECPLYGTEQEELQEVVNKIFYEQPQMDGLFLSNDILAALSVSYALAQGIRVPEELRIIGYDDVWMSSFLYPPLTTIRQNYEKLSEQAIEKMIRMISGEPIEKKTVVPVELIERKTT